MFKLKLIKMKNVMKTMMVAGAFALFAFAPVNVKEACPAPILEPVEEVCVEEEALVCTIRYENGTVEGRCWFCDCDEFALNLH